MLPALGHIGPEVRSIYSVDDKTCLPAGAEQEGPAHNPLFNSPSTPRRGSSDKSTPRTRYLCLFSSSREQDRRRRTPPSPRLPRVTVPRFIVSRLCRCAPEFIVVHRAVVGR